MNPVKDWTGNSRSTIVTAGAHNFTVEDRQENDYYATDPKAMELLLNEETFSDYIWEPACGEGHLSKVLVNHGFHVRSTDKIYRGYGEKQPLDFLEYEGNWNGDIITNPPYRYAKEFIEKALKIIPDGHKVAMFLRIQFIEGKTRRAFFEQNPPRFIYPSSSRLICAMNGDFEKYKKSTAVCYSWWVWYKGYHGDPAIRWIN